MCFADPVKAFDRIPRKVLEWAMRQKRIPEDLVRSEKHLCERLRVRVNSMLSEESEAKVGMHQGSVLSPCHFALVVNIATEFVREGELSELLMI